MKRVLSVACLVSAAVFLVSCTNAAVDKAVGSGAGSGIAVTRTDTGLSVANNTGRPVIEIFLNVELDDPRMPYFRLIPTMEPGQKLELGFTDFRNEDGFLLDPRVVTPKQIKMTGRDTLANHYGSTTPW